VFPVNVPICILAIVAGFFLVPDSRDPDEGKLDPIGAVLSIIGLGGLLYGIIEAPDKGWGSPEVLVAFAIGGVVIAAFFAWELHTDYPMLDIRFFKNPRFSAASATITLTYFALFGSTFLLTQYFQFVLGYSPLKAGVMTAPVAIGIMACAPQAPRFVDRFGTKKVVAGGLLVVAFSLFCYASDTIMSSVVAGIIVRIMFGAGMGFTSAPATESIMGSLPPGKAGVGSAVNDTTRQTGGALGVAVIGSIFLFRYHNIVGSAQGVPESVRPAVQDSIGAALDAARTLPASDAAAVRALVDHAYITSMRLAYGIAALVVLLAAAVTWRYLPARAPDEVEDEGEEDEELAEALSVTTA
jgi:EmrB/QacA subfamily drug resistance transporter